MSNKKLKIAWNSNFPLIKTGLAKNTKYVLDYLVKTGKYEITLYAQGLPWEHPDYQRMPYKVYGCFPNNPIEVQQINNADEGTKRAWTYGNGYIERFIREVRPDIMVFSDDIWSFPYAEKNWWNKFHCIPHITIDSLPILPTGTQLAKASPLFHVWSEFAERELHHLGIKNVRTIPGCIDPNNFRRFDSQTRKNIRFKHGVPENAFIVGTDSRNQLRKEFPALIEGFATFLKQNPEVKNAYLFLITTFNEGWNLPRYIEEFNIPQDKFLALYVCSACQDIHVRPFQGQDLNCPYCKTQKALKTIKIDAGCSEEKLNEAYNLFDCICHVFNAAGLELVHIQALYSELPLASVNYAAGQVFCEQPFISTIEHSWTRQIGTEFKRSCPYPSSVAKYIKKIYNMPEEKRIEIGKKGREWAISKFSPEVVGKQWETLFDSLPKVTWDYNFDYKPKNDKYPFMPEKFNEDVDFVVDLYKNILFLDNENNSECPGVKNWLQLLHNGGKREDVYNFFIKTAREDNAKSTPFDVSVLFENTGKKRALMVIKESAGDCFYISSLFESFHQQYPNTDLYLMVDSKFHSIFEGNPLVFKVLPWIEQLSNELNVIGNGEHQGYCDYFFLPTIGTQYRLNYLSNSNPLLIK